MPKQSAYYEIDGRGVIYVVTPGFFLHALDAKTGRHVLGFGAPVPVEGFPQTGVVDLLVDLLDGWDGPDGDFLRRIRDAACTWFGTTLGPEYNALHRDHFHLQDRGYGTCR